MRNNLRPSLSALSLLALVIPSILVASAARFGPAASPVEVSAGDTRRLAPGGDAGARGRTASPAPAPERAEAAARAKQNYGSLPLSFEANRGQADAGVKFLARGDAYSIFLTADEMALALRERAAPGEAGRAAPRASALRIKLLGANRRPRAYGLDELEAKSNYLIGSDPARWRTGVPNYGRVKYESVYPGVDVVYYGKQRQLEYDFLVAPGADADAIRLRVEGAEGARIEENGDLVLPTAAGEVRQHAPHAYQEVAGVRQTVACRYAERGAGRFGFELGAYDPARPLVIDPVISYSTFLGGSGQDEGTSIAVDAQGHAYVAGNATSTNFPVTPGAFQPNKRSLGVSNDAFITKLNAAGTAVVYSTYLGGIYTDEAASIAVDAAGQAHVAGSTDSTNFPVTAGAHRTTGGGNYDVFVSKLNATGTALLYSTYLGGSNYELGGYLALGSGGEVYVAGRTYSSNFPVTPGAFQPQRRSVSQTSSDGFVTKLSPTAGAALLFSTHLGGGGDEFLEGLAVASGLDDSVYVTGRTTSADFPVTPNALQAAFASPDSGFDAFVTRLNASGTQAVYSTYFGGAGEDYGSAVAVDASGAAYVAGQTFSAALPTTPGSFQPALAGGSSPGNEYDAFLAKLSPGGASLVFSTFFGGNGGDRANAVALDSAGNVYVAGETNSTDLPVSPNALQPNFGGGTFDGFFFKLNAAGAALSYSTYLGGREWEQAKGVALDGAGDVYLTGNTYSYDFHLTPGAAQHYIAGYNDCFVTKIALGVEDYGVSGRVTNEFGNGLRDVEVNITGTVNRVVRTDADGRYRFNGIPQGADVTLRAMRFGFVFEPLDVAFPNLSRNETVDFSGPAPLRISGRVVDDFGNGVYLPLTISGGVNANVNTDYDGHYSFYVPAGGSYTVTPDPHPEFTFAPPSRGVAEMTGDQTFDFTAQRPPRIGVYVRDPYNGGLAEARVTLTSPSLAQPIVHTTDAYGYAYFDELERGATYTLTPSDPVMNRSFTPAQQTVADIQRQHFLEFTALPPLALHGRLTDPNGNGVSGVATLSGAVNAEAPVDDWGYFSFMNLPRGGDYTVTVTKPGSLYVVTPPSRSVTDLQDFEYLEFTALPPLRFMGRVADAHGTGVSATVTISGTVDRTTQADDYGYYSFEELPRGGDYTVTPTFPLHTFAPPSRSVSDAQQDQFFMFEALPPLHIIGEVFDEGGQPVAGATVTLSGAVNATVRTGDYSHYEFRDLPRGGTYTVTPAHELYTFTPPSREFVAMGDNQVAIFHGALRRFTLSGRVADAGGAPLPDVTVTLGGAPAVPTRTDANGNYSFTNLPVGRPYTVTAARPGFSFAPATFNVADPRGDQAANFTATRLTYTLTGRVADAAGGAGLAGVTLSLGGSMTATAQSDAQGNYTFTGLPSEGNYTVAAAHPNFDFAPASRPFNNLLDNVEADFSGTRRKHQIGGRIADGAGVALGGVTVTLGGARSATTQTDSLGQYLFADLPSGFDYTLSAARTHYTFSPPTRSVDGLGGDTTADFAATLLTHTISGRVVDSNGAGFAGATVSLVGPVTASVTTDAGGNYAFNSLPAGGNYTVQPSRQFYDFSPGLGIFNDLGSDQTANFTAVMRTFSIAGRVTEGAAGVAGVTVQLSGSQTAAVQTDAAGNYLFTQLPASGVYTVTPAHPFYAFTPVNTTFNTLPFNQTANFAGARLQYQVSGYTLDACGRAIPGVTVSLARAGQTVTAQTGASGFYSFAGVPAGYDYTLGPTGSTYSFTPPSVSLPALSGNAAANFTGRPPTSTANAAALADLYVRGGTSAGTNFGKATQLITRLASQASNTYETYVKFDAGQPCTVTSVTLRLYGKLSSSGTLPVAVYGVPSTAWTETGMNWNNRPAAGALLRTVNLSGTTAAWYEWDVTDYVRAELAAGRSVVSFALKATASTSYQATFNSREATGTNAPRLVVTTP